MLFKNLHSNNGITGNFAKLVAVCCSVLKEKACQERERGREKGKARMESKYRKTTFCRKKGKVKLDRSQRATLGRNNSKTG